MYRIGLPTCRKWLRSMPISTHVCYSASRPQFKSRTRVDTSTEDDLDNRASELGLRSNRPPDSNPKPEGEPRISDQDWEIRTGRAVYLLQQTLPEFFLAGLITSVDKATGTPHSSSTSIPVLNANPLDSQPYGEEDIEVIYSSKIRFSYTPPGQLPAPFPSTFHVEGLPLYLASAVFIRHTLNALYTDLSLDLQKLVVNTPRAPISAEQRGPNNRIRSRDKSLLLGFCVTGTSRVSGARGEWEVNSTYSFSPSTGLIDKHVVNSIYPAPHQAVYDSLRLSLGKVFGFGIEEERARPNGTAYRGVDAGAKGH